MHFYAEIFFLTLIFLKLCLFGRKQTESIVIVDACLFRRFLQLFNLHKPERNFKSAHFINEDKISLRLLRLLAHRLNLCFKLGYDIADADEVFLCAVKLLFGFFLAVTELCNACRFFKDFAAVSRFDRENLVDSALTDDGIAVSAQACVHKQFVDVFQADRLLVYIKFAVTASVVAACYCDFVVFERENALTIVDSQGNLTVARRMAF